MIVISFDPSSTSIILVHVYANDQALVKICVAASAFIEYVRSILCTAIYIAQTDRIMLAIAASPAADL